MKVRTLELAALALQFSLALSSPSAIDDHRFEKVRSWHELSRVSTSPIPAAHSEAGYQYTAVKFAASVGGLIDAAAQKYSAATGWEDAGPLGSLPNYRVFRKRSSRLGKRGGGVPSKDGLSEELGVAEISMLNQRKRLYKRSFVSEGVRRDLQVAPRQDLALRQGPAGFGDGTQGPSLSKWEEIKDPRFGDQWHLVNTVEKGHDINVTGVWRQGVTGQGVTVALIDDGLDYTSEDLLDNFDFGGSYDFNDKTKLPTPRLSDDYHGTRCAGQIAAKPNDVCGVGVAYGAKVAGIRMLSAQVYDREEIEALNYAMDTNWIYSCSWGPEDNGETVQGPSKPVEDAFIHGIEKGRGGLGSLYVFATGNGGHMGDNCNFDGYTNSIYTISIGAINHLDQHPPYSEMCSAQLAVTYSNGDNRGIVTTDLGVRACTNKHGGTSAAAPLAAGIFALALSVRPDLTWRDVQHLAVRTAIPVDTGDNDWKDVAQGRKYNHKYGFGKLDAGRIVEAARTFQKVGRQTKIVAAKDAPNARIEPITGHNSVGKAVERTVLITEQQVADAKMKRVEHVTVSVDIKHDFRGNIEVWLKSPSGIRSQLAAARPRDSDTEGLHGWRFMTVKHWDEEPAGNWTLQVRNAQVQNHSGRLNEWQMTLFGESTEEEPHHTVPTVGGDRKITATETTTVTVTAASSSETKGAEASAMRKGATAAISGGFFFLGAVLSALAVILLMRRRERKLASMRWTQLDDLNDGFVDGRAASRSVDQPEEDEDGDVYEFAELESAGTRGGIRLKPGDEASDDDGDDRTRGNSSKGSGEEAPESQHLV